MKNYQLSASTKAKAWNQSVVHHSGNETEHRTLVYNKNKCNMDTVMKRYTTNSHLAHCRLHSAACIVFQQKEAQRYNIFNLHHESRSSLVQ